MPKPLVTAVIPSYNYGRYIERAIDSVLAQSYQPIECIVVDDGSTDDTKQRLARYAGRVEVLDQRRQGPGVARNFGARHGTGEYIAYLDADDCWEPEKIAKQVARLEANPRAGAVGCGARLVDTEGRLKMTLDYGEFAGIRNERLGAVARRQFWVGGSDSGVLIRRSVLDHVGGFDETLGAAEDWDLWMRVAAEYAIENVREPLVTILVHRASIFRNARMVERFQWQVYRKAKDQWPEVMRGGVERQVRATIRRDAGNEHLSAGDSFAAAARFWQAVAEWPWSARHWTLAGKSSVRCLLVLARPRRTAGPAP